MPGTVERKRKLREAAAAAESECKALLSDIEDLVSVPCLQAAPGDDECCFKGCTPCVWDVYEDQIEVYVEDYREEAKAGHHRRAAIAVAWCPLRAFTGPEWVFTAILATMRVLLWWYLIGCVRLLGFRADGLSSADSVAAPTSGADDGAWSAATFGMWFVFAGVVDDPLVAVTAPIVARACDSGVASLPTTLPAVRSFLMAIDWSSDVAAGAAVGALLAFLLALVTSGRRRVLSGRWLGGLGVAALLGVGHGVATTILAGTWAGAHGIVYQVVVGVSLAAAYARSELDLGAVLVGCEALAAAHATGGVLPWSSLGRGYVLVAMLGVTAYFCVRKPNPMYAVGPPHTWDLGAKGVAGNGDGDGDGDEEGGKKAGPVPADIRSDGEKKAQ